MVRVRLVRVRVRARARVWGACRAGAAPRGRDPPEAEAPASVPG